MARALRHQSGLPPKYWGDCVLTAAYLINRLHTPVLNNKSPFEMLYHKLPDYGFLRAFGCLCFASVHPSDKFAPRAIKSVFLGYPFNHKGYNLLNLENYTTFVSRHVVFHEYILSYHSVKNDKSVSNIYNFQDWCLEKSHTSSIFHLLFLLLILITRSYVIQVSLLHLENHSPVLLVLILITSVLSLVPSQFHLQHKLFDNQLDLSLGQSGGMITVL